MDSLRLEHLISLDSTVVAASNQVSCDLAGEAVILNLASGIYYGLDPVGARIWELIQEPRTVDNICDILLAEYEVEADRCRHDLVALLGQMAEQALIEVSNGTGS